MSARTEALVSQPETGKIAGVHRSLLRPVVTRRVPWITPESVQGFQKYVTSTAVPSTIKMLTAMMKRKNLPISSLASLLNPSHDRSW